MNQMDMASQWAAVHAMLGGQLSGFGMESGDQTSADGSQGDEAGDEGIMDNSDGMDETAGAPEASDHASSVPGNPPGVMPKAAAKCQMPMPTTAPLRGRTPSSAGTRPPMGFVPGGSLSAAADVPSNSSDQPRGRAGLGCWGADDGNDGKSGKGTKRGWGQAIDVRRDEPMRFVSAGTLESEQREECGTEESQQRADMLQQLANLRAMSQNSWDSWASWSEAGDDMGSRSESRDDNEEELRAPGITQAFGGEKGGAKGSSAWAFMGGVRPPGKGGKQMPWDSRPQHRSGCPPNLRGTPGAPVPPSDKPQGRLCVQAPRGGRVAIMMVAEKPAIAQAFAVAVAPQGKYQKENRGSLPTFCFNAPWVGGSGPGPSCLTPTTMCEYRITSTIGHVYSCDFPPQMRNWNRFDPEALFDAKTVKNEANEDAKLPQHLADEASRCNVIILCLDCDREGENIAFEALDSVVPNLACHSKISTGNTPECDTFAGMDFSSDQRVWRAKFSSLSPNDLRMCLRSLQKPNQLEARSVDARAEIDLKVGVALSRLITMNLREDAGELAPAREGEGAKHGALLSYGPCQTPTLGFCVERWDQIQNFNKQVSHTLDLRVRSPSGSIVTLFWVPSRDLLATTSEKGQCKGKGKRKGKGGFQEAGTTRKEVLDEFVKRIQDAGDTECEVESVTSTPAIVERPVALNTVEMLRLSSRELGIDPQRTMAVAEKLYLSGLMTYPRTETQKYPTSMNMKDIVTEHAEHKNWGSWCRYLLQGNLNEPREGHDAGDHPPITPVWCASEQDIKKVTGNMSRDAIRLYEMVTKHLLASVSPDVQFTRHEAFVELEGFRFALKGNEVTDWGYARIFQGAVRSAQNSGALSQWNLLKPLRLALAQQMESGMRLKVAGLNVRRLVSSPPKLLTEAELLSLMEKEQIGTDASMPTHVNNVVQRGYVEVVGDDRRMKPTVLGVWLVHGLQNIDDELTKPEVRAGIERDVTLVANGDKGCEDVVASAVSKFRIKFQAVRDGVPLLKEALLATKEAKHQWAEKAEEEEQATEQPPDDEEGNVVIAPKPLSPSEIPASGTKRPRESQTGAGADSSRRVKARTADSGIATSNGKNLSPLQQLQAENKVLEKKLEIAVLRAENAELKFTTMERKHAELEARVGSLQAAQKNKKKTGKA